jgi:hypothetical protein
LRRGSQQTLDEAGLLDGAEIIAGGGLSFASDSACDASD